MFNDQFQGQISNQDFFKQLNVWYKVGVLKEDPAAYIDLYKSLLALDTQGTTELNKQNIEPALADFASKMFSSAQDALTKTGNKSPDLRNIEKKTKGLMDAL